MSFLDRLIKDESPVRTIFTLASDYRIVVSHVRWVRGTLRAQVRLTRKADNATLLVVEHDLNTLADRERLITAISRCIDADDENTMAAELGSIFARVHADHVALTEPVPLHQIEPVTEERTEAIDGFPVLMQHPTIIFGDGGTGKSLLTLWLVGRLAQQDVRVLWLDWELEGNDHRERLAELFGDDLPENIHYLRCEASIGVLAEQLRHQVTRLGIDLIVVDSAAFAIEGDPSTAEAARMFFQSLRSLGRVGSIVIAHETKNSDHEKPFGSVFWHNGARLTWHISIEQSVGRPPVVLLECKKDNLRTIPKGSKARFRVSSPFEARTEIKLLGIQLPTKKIGLAPSDDSRKGQILKFLRKHSTSSKTAIFKHVGGRKADVFAEVAELDSKGLIVGNDEEGYSAA